MKRTAFLSAMAVMMLATPAMAEPMTFNFDKKHTQVMFSVSHMGFSKSHGKFLDFDGQFTFDPANPKAGGTAEVTINTASLDMGDDAWNKHMVSADFFNSEKFPTMVFKSTGVKDIDKDDADLHGDLTLLGVTKPVKLDVELNKCENSPMTGALVCGFSAEGKIKRSDWGMSYGLPGVGDEVKIRIEVEASPVVAAAAAAQ